MTFLLGRQAILGHDPPIIDRSTTIVLCPRFAKLQAMSLPRAPQPRTTFSYDSTGIGPPPATEATIPSLARPLPSHRQHDAEAGLAAHHPRIRFGGFLQWIAFVHRAHALSS